MGKLHYGNDSLSVDFHDDLLAHLQALISAKLRRNESFMLNWTTPGDNGGTRVCIWVNASIPMSFHFDQSERQPLDSGLLNELAIAAASSNGLDLSGLMTKTRSGRASAVERGSERRLAPEPATAAHAPRPTRVKVHR